MTEESRRASFWELFRSRNFRLLWGAGSLSAIGDQFDLIAFPWLVLVVTGDPLAIGLVIAVGNIPTFFFLLIGGSLVDRFSPRIMMLASDAMRVVLVVSLAVLILTGLTNLWLIYLFAALKGITDSFYYPAHLAILPRVVPFTLLRQSNAVVLTTVELSSFIGPALAGGLIALFSGDGASTSGADMTGIGLAFAVAALPFAVSALMLLLMRTDDSGPEIAGQDAEESGVLSSIRQGVQYVRADGATLALLLLIAGTDLLVEGPLIVGIPVLADSRLTEGALALGIITSAFAGGSVLGAVLAGVLPAPRRGLGPIIVAFIALSGIFMMPVGFLRAMWTVAGLALAMGVMGGYVDILVMSWLQGRTPRAMLGRVMSLLMVSTIGLSPFSIAASGALIRLSLEWVILGSGALMAMFTIALGLRREIRTMRMTEE